MTVSEAIELSGLVAQGLSGSWLALEASHEPDAAATGDPEDARILGVNGRTFRRFMECYNEVSLYALMDNRHTSHRCQLVKHHLTGFATGRAYNLTTKNGAHCSSFQSGQKDSEKMFDALQISCNSYTLLVVVSSKP